MFGVRHSVTLSFKLSGSLPLRAVDLSAAVNSGCSDEAALRLTDREEMRVCREQRKKHHLYIGRGRRGGEKKSENRAQRRTRGETEVEIQKQQQLIKREQLCDTWANGRKTTPKASVTSSLQTPAGWSAALYVCSGSPGIQGISQPRSHSLSSVTLATYFLHGNSISRCVRQRKRGGFYARPHWSSEIWSLDGRWHRFAHLTL